MPTNKKKQCFICGDKYEDSVLGPDGESNFCHLCRQIKDKIALKALASLAQQIVNISSYVFELKDRIKKLENKNAK